MASDRNEPRPFARPILVFLTSFAVLAILANRTGYEGDDLNSVLPMLNLDAALDGQITIYRYPWHPLSYHIGAAVAGIAGSPWPIFLLAPLCIALSLSMLYGLLSRLYGVPVGIFACIILLSPEILYSGLYYNSTALGYSAAVGALVLTFRPPGAGTAVAIGLLLGAAALLRLDFVLIIPAMLILGWFQTGSPRWPLLSGIVAAAVGVGALVSGFVDIAELLSIYEFATVEMAERANQGGWNFMSKAFVASTILSPLGFAYYGIGVLWLLRVLPRRQSLQGLVIFIALLPAMMSLPKLLSVKYLLHNFVLLPLLGGRIWREAHDRLRGNGRWLDAGLGAGTVFLLFASVDVDNQKPYVQLAFWESRQIATHDGHRSWGAYLPQMMRVERLSQPSEAKRNGRALATAIRSGSDRTIVFVGKDWAFGSGAVGWRHAALELAYAGIPGTVEGPHLKLIQNGNSRLWLTESLETLPETVRDDPATVVLYGDDPDLTESIGRL